MCGRMVDCLGKRRKMELSLVVLLLLLLLLLLLFLLSVGCAEVAAPTKKRALATPTASLWAIRGEIARLSPDWFAAREGEDGRLRSRPIMGAPLSGPRTT